MTKQTDELISLVLWSIRRLPKAHQEFAYKELTKVAGEHQYVKDVMKEINKPKPKQEDGTWRGFTD